jgi:hypothetical protein
MVAGSGIQPIQNRKEQCAESVSARSQCVARLVLIFPTCAEIIEHLS